MSTALSLSILLTVMLVDLSTSAVTMETAAIRSVPPSVSIAPIRDKHTIRSIININPFLTNSLLQALADESEHKRRFQRYREVNF